MKVLLVEVDSAEREILEEALRFRGHEVQSCQCDRLAEDTNGGNGQQIYPLVIANGCGSGENFRELCQQIRTIAQQNHSFFLALTSTNRPDTLEELLGAGADDCLRTDTSAEELSLRLAVIERRIRERTERQEQEEALRYSEQKLSLHVKEAMLAAIDWDTDFRITSWNPAAERIFGYEESEVLGQIAAGLIFPEGDEDDAEDFFSALLQQHDRHPITMQHRTKTGSVVTCKWYNTLLYDGAGRIVGVSSLAQDITKYDRADSHHLYDTLTALPSRSLFMDRLGRCIQLSKRLDDYRFAVISLGLDRFKVINDSFGHTTVDQLLVEIARRLERHVRRCDTVARFGGDEFVVLAEDVVQVSGLITVATRLQEAFKDPFMLDEREVFVSASIGIALGSQDYPEPEELLRNAHAALYRAKSLGHGRFEVFHHSMHDSAVRFLKLDSDLRRAIERGEFQVYYQPIILLETGELTAFEALVRWCHPECGLIYPEDFISVSEETGLIVELGHWVIQKSCEQLHAWHRSLPNGQKLSMNVNLSGRQFAQSGLFERIEGVLEETGIEPRYLSLEITESVAMSHAETTIDLLRRFKDLDVGLHMDDFGTGYSSLSYLQRFPIDGLKIDRSFIGPMGQNGEEQEIVGTIVQLARNLGMETTAEGIETPEQLDQLRSMKCSHGQGFFFSKAVPAQEAEELIFALPRKW